MVRIAKAFIARRKNIPDVCDMVERKLRSVDKNEIAIDNFAVAFDSLRCLCLYRLEKVIHDGG